MQLHNFNTYFFFLLLFGVSAGAFLLFEPFLSAIFVAALFAGMFHGLYDRLVTLLRGRVVISSFIVCVIAAFAIVLPLFGVVRMVSDEVTTIVTGLTTEGSQMQSSLAQFADTVVHSRVGEMVADVSGIDIDQSLSDIVSSIGERFLGLVQSSSGGSSAAAGAIVSKTYSSVVSAVIWIFVMFFTLFYFLIDGKRFLATLMRLSPLRDEHERMLFDRFSSMARATLRGTLIIGGIQGFFGGLAFAVAGVASPGLWTVIMIFLAIIPALGAGLVIFPAAVIMLFLGSLWQGIFLLAVGAVVTSIDNVLRPKLVGKDTQMHSLLVFFGTLGGMSLFGLIGFIIGPIILALALALWEIYATTFRDQLRAYNE